MALTFGKESPKRRRHGDRMFKTTFAAATALLLAQAAQAMPTYSYVVDSAVCELCPFGSGEVTGTIVTNALGDLTEKNVVDWTLDLSVDSGEFLIIAASGNERDTVFESSVLSTTLTPLNSQFIIGGANPSLVGTPEALEFSGNPGATIRFTSTSTSRTTTDELAGEWRFTIAEQFEAASTTASARNITNGLTTRESISVEGVGGTASETRDGSFARLAVGAPSSEVPLPAAGWLLFGGLGALAVASRRRKAA
ncbi:MAG: VPLPA-CTERM sorting domain-containing protein [Pseudomonadota bacterium]